MGIDIESHREDDTEINFIHSQDEFIDIFKNNDIIKLFYQNHRKYECYSQNWGESKGADNFTNVCVVLNDNTMNHYNQSDLINLKPRTKNKLYVACSRANHNLYFIEEKKLKEYLKTFLKKT